MATNPLEHLMPKCAGSKAVERSSVFEAGAGTAGATGAAGAAAAGDPLAGTLRVNEIFHSIQGESTWAGEPCVFVRLTGCPLRCRYCDTEYSFREGQTRTVAEVVAAVEATGCKLVELTGGEPLAQKRAFDLMRILCDRGCTVLVETSGAIDIAACDPRVIRILDIKTPGSGEAERNLWSNLQHLRAHDEVKFVIVDRADYEWAREVIAHRGLARALETGALRCILMSPAWEQPAGKEIAGVPGLHPRQLAQWILADRLPVRLQVQLHKIIWDPQTRGV
ncbi:MAG: radical SAM protein [Phycisphaerales bacterium]